MNNKLCLTKPKKPTFDAPTPGLEIIYFKFRLNQESAGFVETRDKLARYASVTYNHEITKARKYMEYMKVPEYTDPKFPMNPTERVDYKKWGRVSSRITIEMYRIGKRTRINSSNWG